MNDTVGLRYEVQDPVAVITLDRPDNLNAFTWEMLAALRDRIAEAVADPRVVGIVITGTGRGFCVGLDASTMHATTAGQPVDPAALGHGRFPGMFSYLLVGCDALARCSPDMSLLSGLDGAGVSVFAWDGEVASCRVFAGGVGVAEDPATGSAALGLGVFLVAAGLLPEGGDYTVRQGVEMGRPSRLDGSVVASGGAAVSATVRGGVVPVATGRVRRP